MEQAFKQFVQSISNRRRTRSGFEAGRCVWEVDRSVPQDPEGFWTDDSLELGLSIRYGFVHFCVELGERAEGDEVIFEGEV
jgi:hypothetical protein